MKSTIRHKQGNKKKPELSIEYIDRVRKLFDEKNWEIKDAFGYDAFDNFCKMLTPLNEEECELMLELSRNFVIVREDDYLRYFGQAFNQFISESNLPSKTTLVLCPLLAPEDFNRNKSSIFIYYMVKKNITGMQLRYSDYNITYVEKPDQYNPNNYKPGTVLCLVDDFIGTGETAVNAADYFLTKGVKKDQIYIISVAGMNHGINHLRGLDYNAYATILCPKGISDSNELRSKKFIMESIEERINVKEEYRFGYGRSEGLIKMVSTPNNTFPIYWIKKNNTPPFPRV